LLRSGNFPLWFIVKFIMSAELRSLQLKNCCGRADEIADRPIGWLLG